MIRHLTLPIVFCFVLLAGCTGAVKPTAPKPSPQLTSLQPDPSLLQSCPKLPKFDVTKPVSMGDLYSAYSALQGQYATCATHYLCLIEAVQDKTKTCPNVKQTPSPPTTSQAEASGAIINAARPITAKP